MPGPGKHDQLKPEESLMAQGPGFQPWLSHYHPGDLRSVAASVWVSLHKEWWRGCLAGPIIRSYDAFSPPMGLPTPHCHRCSLTPLLSVCHEAGSDTRRKGPQVPLESSPEWQAFLSGPPRALENRPQGGRNPGQN